MLFLQISIALQSITGNIASERGTNGNRYNMLLLGIEVASRKLSKRTRVMTAMANADVTHHAASGMRLSKTVLYKMDAVQSSHEKNASGRP